MVRKTKKYGRKTKSVKKYKKGGSVRKNNYNKFSRKNNNQNNFYNNLIKQIQNKFIKGGAWTGTPLKENKTAFRVVKLESKPNTDSNVSEITAKILPDANMDDKIVDTDFASKFTNNTETATTHIWAKFGYGKINDDNQEKEGPILLNFMFGENLYDEKGTPVTDEKTKNTFKDEADAAKKLTNQEDNATKAVREEEKEEKENKNPEKNENLVSNAATTLNNTVNSNNNSEIIEEFTEEQYNQMQKLLKNNNNKFRI